LLFHGPKLSREKYSRERETMKLIGKWKPPSEISNQKGGTNGYYIMMGIVIAVVAIVVIEYFQDRGHDFHVHMPRVEVH
jgi:hypothetical protein